jgi:hypothetical protein
MELVITLITSITALIVAITSLVKLFRQSAKIQEIHLSINSRMDELLKLSRENSFAKGVKSETDKDKK